MNKRRYAFVVLSLALLSVCTWAAFRYWLPELVRGRIEARLHARTGLHVQTQGVAVSLSRATIEELRIGTPAVGLSVVATGLAVGFDPLRALTSTAAAVRDVHLERVELDLDASKSDLPHRLRASGGRAGARGAGEAAARALPGLRLEGGVVRIRDLSGQLVDVGLGQSVVESDGGFVAVVERAQLGDAPHTTLSAEEVVLAGTLEGHRPRVGRLSVGDWRMRVASRPDEGPEPEGSDASAPDDAEVDLDSDEDGQAGGAEPGRAVVPPDGLVDRLMALRAWLAAPAPGPAPAAPRAGASGARRAGFDAWWTGDAAITAPRGAASGVGADRVGALEAISLRAVREGKAWRVDGEARGVDGGRVSGKFTVAGSPLRADGRLDVEGLPLSAIAPLLPFVPWRKPVTGHLEAELVVETTSVERIGLDGAVEIEGASFESPRLAATPVRDVHVRLRGRGALLPLRRRLEVEDGEVILGDTPIQVRGGLELDAEHYAVDAHATLTRMPCDDAVRGIPPDLLGDLVHARWGGTLGASLALKLDSRQLDATELDISFDDRCAFEQVPAFVDLRRFREPFVQTVFEGDGEVFEFQTGPGSVHWTYLEDVSPLLVHAVLAHEDGGFFKHSGFSTPHIRNALVRDLREGRYAVGASTITMQLVKNIFLRREKTLARKTQEVLLTWWIERAMDKRDILELYLNVIEYGPGVYGIRDAARYYFKRLPSDLSPAEAVYLSTILPNPKRYHVQYELGRVSARWAERMRKILRRLQARHRYEPQVVEYGLSELSNFSFVKEGQVAKARTVPTGVAPLPYMEAGLSGWDEADYAPLPDGYLDD